MAALSTSDDLRINQNFEGMARIVRILDDISLFWTRGFAPVPLGMEGQIPMSGWMDISVSQKSRQSPSLASESAGLYF